MASDFTATEEEYEGAGGGRGYEGPNRKDPYKKKGNTFRHCHYCNTVISQNEIVYVDKDMTPTTNVSYSLHKKNRWEHLDDESYFIAPSEGSPSVKQVGKEIQSSNSNSNNSNSNNNNDANKTQQNGRQARKKQRQEKAKNNKSARKDHKKVTSTEEDTKVVPSSSTSSSTSEEEDDEEKYKEYALIYGKNLDPKWTGKVVCKQCSNSKKYSNEKKGKKSSELDLVLN